MLKSIPKNALDTSFFIQKKAPKGATVTLLDKICTDLLFPYLKDTGILIKFLTTRFGMGLVFPLLYKHIFFYKKKTQVYLNTWVICPYTVPMQFKTITLTSTKVHQTLKE